MLETRPAPAPAIMDGDRCLSDGGGGGRPDGALPAARAVEREPAAAEEEEEEADEDGEWAGLCDEAKGWVLRYLGVPAQAEG